MRPAPLESHVLIYDSSGAGTIADPALLVELSLSHRTVQQDKEITVFKLARRARNKNYVTKPNHIADHLSGIVTHRTKGVVGSTVVRLNCVYNVFTV